MEPEVFAVIIEAFGILPENMIPIISYVIPILELIIGAALLIDLYGAMALVTLVLFFFIAVLGYGIHLGLDIDCGCFGPSDPEFKAFNGLRIALYRDFAFLGLVALIYTLRAYLNVVPLRLGSIRRYKV